MANDDVYLSDSDRDTLERLQAGLKPPPIPGGVAVANNDPSNDLSIASHLMAFKPDMGGASNYPASVPMRATQPGGDDPDSEDGGEESAKAAPQSPIPRSPSMSADPSTQGQSKPAPSMSSMTVTPEDVERAASERRKLAALGAIGDTLGSQQSFGNFYLGRMNPQSTAGSRMAEALSEQADSPIKAKIMAQQQALKGSALALTDADSMQSKMARNISAAKVRAYASSPAFKDDPDSQKQLNSIADQFQNAKLSGVDVDQLSKSYGLHDILQSDTAWAKMSGMMALANARLAQGEQRINLQKDNQAAGAAAALDKDPLLQSTQRQLQQIGVDRHTLKNASIITPQMVHEISNGVASALNQGKAVGLGMAEMQDMGTSQTKLAQLEGWLTNNPKNGASEEVKAQILDTLDRLEDSYRKAQSGRAKQIAVGKAYAGNPAAQQAVADKVRSYQPDNEGSAPGSKRKVSQAEIQDYAEKHGMNPNAAATWLRSQGYATD